MWPAIAADDGAVRHDDKITADPQLGVGADVVGPLVAAAAEKLLDLPNRARGIERVADDLTVGDRDEDIADHTQQFAALTHDTTPGHMSESGQTRDVGRLGAQRPATPCHQCVGPKRVDRTGRQKDAMAVAEKTVTVGHHEASDLSIIRV